MNAARILEVARADVGRTEDPMGSNHVPGITLPGASYPWCAIWIASVLLRSGIDCPLEPSARKMVGYWQDHGIEIPLLSAPLQPADLVLTNRYDESGTVIGGHIAFVESDDGRHLIVIAGNHGNAVARYEQERRKIVGVARVVAG